MTEGVEAVLSWFEEPGGIAIIEAVPGIASLLPSPPTQDYSDAVTLVQDFEEGLQHTWNGASGKAKLDIDGLTQDGAPDGGTDYVATWDASAGAHKKVLLDDLPGGGGGGAPTTATYVTMTLNGSLSAERTLAGESSVVSITDGGANGNVTVGITALGIGTAKLADNSVTYVKIQDVSAASKLLGRGDSGSGDPQEITLGTGLSMSGTTLNGSAGVSDGDKGDITVTASGATWTIDNDVVTYAKMQNVSAAIRVLGRGSAGGSGDVQELTLGSGLSMTGTLLDAVEPVVRPTDLEYIDGPRIALRGSSGSGTGDEGQVDSTLEIGFDDFAYLRRAAITGDISIPSGSNTATFSAPIVSFPYAPGSFTIATGRYSVMSKRLQLTSSQRGTIQGTARLRIT